MNASKKKNPKPSKRKSGNPKKFSKWQVSNSLNNKYMKIKDFNLYTDHIWKMREYLQQIDLFDYPWYGGLKGKFKGSPEACDAFQNIWHYFCDDIFKTKSQFKNAYKKELNRLGEKIENR